MALVQDILFDEDISIVNGDLGVGPSDQQHIEHILIAAAGQFYQFPTLGVNITKDLQGTSSGTQLKQRTTKNLVSDNYRVDRVNVEGNIILSVDATRRNG